MGIKITASTVKNRFTVEPGRPSGAGYVPYETLTGATVSAKTNSVADTTPQNQVTYLPGTYEFVDFADANTGSGFGFGGYFTPNVGGMCGSGVDQTIFQMRPSSSTRQSEVPADGTLLTNNFAVVRAGGDGSHVRATQFTGFTLRGTSQGMLYNGWMVYHVTSGLMQDVKVIGIPGDASVQPGETFGINDFHTSFMTYNRIEIDGRDYQSGVRVGASGFGGNQGNDLTVTNSSSHHLGYSAGWTCNTYTNITYTNVTATDTAKMGFNFERVGGTVTMTNCTMLRCATVHISIASDTTNAVYHIDEPIFDGTVLQVKISGFSGGARTQDPNNVHFTIGGVAFVGTARPDLANVVVTG